MERLGLERLGEELKDPEFWKGENEVALRHWASTRGQTLFRTGIPLSSMCVKSTLPVEMTHNFIFVVKGMMYYRQALNNLLEQGKAKICAFV